MPRPFLIAGLASLARGCSSVTITSDDLLSPSQPITSDPVVRISASGIRPDVNHVNRGAPIRFVNEGRGPAHSRGRPELGYGDCPDIARLSTLAAGQEAVMAVERDGICAIKDAE